MNSGLRAGLQCSRSRYNCEEDDWTQLIFKVDIINGIIPICEEDNTRQPIFYYKCGVGKAHMCFLRNHVLKKKVLIGESKKEVVLLHQ